MRYVPQCFFLLLASCLTCAGQTTTITELRELDKIIGNPASKELLTDRAHDLSVFRDQQAIGGSVIREGKVVGSSAAVDEKGVTVTLGLPLWTKRGFDFSLQPTFQGRSEEGFVKVFSKDDYGRTLGGGLNALLFVPVPWGNRTVYAKNVRLGLHDRVRRLRNENEGQLFPRFELNTRPATAKWFSHDARYGPTDWHATYLPKAEKFVAAWRKLQKAEKDYDNAEEAKVPAAALAALANTLAQAQASYHKAATEMGDLMPKDWDDKRDWARSRWADDYFDGSDKLKPACEGKLMDDYNEAQRAQRLKLYDSLQVAAPVVRRQLVWFNVGLLGNSAKQAVFAVDKPTDGFSRTYHDDYVDIRIGLNGLLTHHWGKQYGSFGFTLSDKRNFEKKNLKTYEYAVWQKTGTDSVRVVTQSQAYPVPPDAPWVQGWQAQYAVYFSQARFKVGLDVTVRTENARTYTERRWVSTFGVFVPIQNGETTLLLMPQLRYDTRDSPTPVTLGFNLAASIPGFVTKKAP